MGFIKKLSFAAILAATISQDGLVSATTTTSSGTFSSPAAVVRPKFRYWLPDASVDPTLVAADIKGIASIGAGGIEFNNDYSNGGAFGVATDWDVYGFGLPKYNAVLKAAAQASKDNGIVMDYAIGPGNGQGVPAAYNNPGLAYNLISFNVTIAPGGFYSGKIPGWKNGGTLISLTTAKIVKIENTTVSGIGASGLPSTYAQTVYTVADSSIKDITGDINKNGNIYVSWDRVDSTAIEYVLYAAYYVLSGDKNCVAGPDPQTFLQNGSFIVDHFSKTGAKVTTDFLEQYVLVNGVKELMTSIGGYLWEDSVEIHSPGFWTPSLTANFSAQHGYSIGKYAMLLAANSGLQFMVDYPIAYITDAADQGQGYVADWRSTMTSLLSDYYQHLVDWSQSYLSSPFSGEVGYNLPVDMPAVVPVVGVPEDELLSFDNNIDSYRQFSGAANLAGKQIISNEMGAVILSAYQTEFPMLLNQMSKAYSGGSNQFVIHGATYSYNFTNTTYPGFTNYGYLFSDLHSRHQPAWLNGYSDVLAYISRNNWILQAGVPKRDVAFWLKNTATISPVEPEYNYTDLATAGYSYDYLSPDNFALPNAVVTNQILAETGPAYRALVIRGTDTLTLAGAKAVAAYANKGLTVIISGGIPTKIAAPTGLAAAQKQLQSILSLSNVYQVASGPLASALSNAGIKPLTTINANATWYTSWREDATAGISYVYIYNSGDYSTGSITFTTTRIPFVYNAWTGAQTPVLQYTVSTGKLTIPLTLAMNQTTIFAFLTSTSSTTPVPSVHVETAPSSVLGYSYSVSAGLTAKIPYSSSTTTIVTSDAVSHTIAAQKVRAPFTLGNWTLIVESWTSPANPYDLTPVAVKTNSTYTLPSLQSWTSIPGLENVAGVGYYSTSFTIAAATTTSPSFSAAVVDFGRVVHTLRVKINGVQLPPLDLAGASADISSYLVVGKNTVEAVTSTPLYNALIPIWYTMKTAGQGPLVPPISGPLEGGLVGTVTVTPYVAVKLN